MILIDLLISALLGVALHQLRPQIDKLSDGWRELTSYAVGVTGAGPLFALWWHRLKDVENPFNRAFLAFLLAFVGVGSGVATGWMLDTFKDDLKGTKDD